jgi:hypothetical protein
MPLDTATLKPIQAIATSSRIAAIVTKMSLKPVISRKLSSSTADVALDRATLSRSAAAAAGVIAPLATAASISDSLYMRSLSLWAGE